VFYDHRVRLVSEFVGALGAGALVFVVARQLGIETRRAFGAVALVPLSVAALLAAPALHDAAADLLHQRKVNAPLSDAEAQLAPGVAAGMNVAFLAWVKDQMAGEETFHMEVGIAPGESVLEGVGEREGLILQWGLFQLAPHLEVEADQADWIVFYESDPTEHAEGSLGEVMTYAPGFAIARNKRAS
jgi:hypothetical protein